MRKLLVIGAALLAACGGDGTGPSGANKDLSVGGSRQLDDAERTTLTVTGGSTGAEYVLIPFYGDSVYQNGAVSNINRPANDTVRRKLDLAITATGVEATSGAPSPLRAPATGTALFAIAGAAPSATGGADLRPDYALHTRMMRRAQRATAGELPAIGAAARARSATTGAARLAVTALATPAVGDVVTYNTNANDFCQNPTRRQGRVAAVTDRAVVVSDVNNPPGGFTDADYRSFGVQFDTLVYSLDVENFGTPGDVDQNGGRAVIFYTRAVNELTPANSSFYVGGFFSARDLLPVAAQGTYDGCAGSNYSEMFYMLAPDPAGLVNGNIRTAAFVRGVTIRTLAHEFQHLINFSRRLALNAAFDEDVWLNEGLSHAAEELLFYRVSGARPGQNLTAGQVLSPGQYAATFTEYGKGDLDNLNSYLKNPEGNSPYADNDSIATRGASWQLIRYLVDRKGGTQSATFKALVNTRYGISNLTSVFGEDAFNLIRDWATAQYVDDGGVDGVGDQLTQPSWNFRSVMPRYQVNENRFPLPVRSLVAPQRFTLISGGAAYLRFRVPANGTATITTATQTGAAVPATLRQTLLRTQ